MNRPQRTVLVVGLGALAMAVEGAIVPLLSGGWFGYAPNTSVVYEPDNCALRLIVRLVLAVAWTAASMAVLRKWRDD